MRYGGRMRGSSLGGRRRGPSLAEKIVGNPNCAKRSHLGTLHGQLKSCQRNSPAYETISEALRIVKSRYRAVLRKELERPEEVSRRPRRFSPYL